VQLVMAVCDVISVLDFGRVIAKGTPAEIQSDEAASARQPVRCPPCRSTSSRTCCAGAA